MKIEITRTLTQEEAAALSINNKSAEVIANRLADRLEADIASEVQQAKQRLTTDKTISQLEALT